ncbi:hypothetical protein C8R45DRAFT_932517 [Mycena sanguinolenta]|nr:hypothetical protein C8R45DRAFT_932517 [Mycena sanguinolenta]
MRARASSFFLFKANLKGPLWWKKLNITQNPPESWPAAFCDFLRGRTLTLFSCIDEMLKDMAQLRTSRPRGRSFWDYFCFAGVVIVQAAAVVVGESRAGRVNNFGGLFVVPSPLGFLSVDPVK